MGAMTPDQVLATELETVDPKLPLLYERDDTWFSFVEKRPAEVVSARDMRVPLNIRPGGKFRQFNAAGGDMGRGAGTTYEKAVLTTVDFSYAKEWQLKTDWATDEKRKAVVQTIRQEIATAMAEFRKHSDSIALTSGNGVLATVESTTNAGGFDTVVLDNTVGARLLRFGQDVNIYDSTLATHRTVAGEKEITFLDIPSRTIKFATMAGLIAGDKIVVGGVSGANPVSVYGQPYHASSASVGTWLSFDRALWPEVRANSVAANAGALALPHARLAINKIGDRLGIDTQVNVVAWMHPCQQQAYEELGQLVSIINKDSGSKGLDLYFNDNMRIAGAPIKKHFSWNKKRIDFTDKDIWARAEMKKAQFLTVDGVKIFPVRGASGGLAASLLTYIVASWNMYVNKPPAISYIDDLGVPAGY